MLASPKKSIFQGTELDMLTPPPKKSIFQGTERDMLMKLYIDNPIEMHCVAEELNNARILVQLSEVDHSISNECELAGSI